MFIYQYHNYYASTIIGLIITIIGILLFVYRDAIGNFTGYYVGRGRFIDKPTPGWLLIPFAVAFIVGGFIILLKSVQNIIASQ